jgi:hypothetical protein
MPIVRRYPKTKMDLQDKVTSEQLIFMKFHKKIASQLIVCHTFELRNISETVLISVSDVTGILAPFVEIWKSICK